ncbi:hypothetical protein CERSUDRAFT_151988 [Gelatoporia subvermispora B]|uniref:Oxo-4-hydroxy-4-carboxy-5-ureidoimidazoline decarboxylase domain-containing protein n=1 Tax=Ceriporiopsis subvermispora (strain B) TaxID=914234 RepID=M2RJT7_CERS8|nr:hypothetical protein CERSUDRAFT_151988 [Gelatoporia subvermispora B]
MSSLPALPQILSSLPTQGSPLADVLSLLFEPSLPLFDHLIPTLHAQISKPDTPSESSTSSRPVTNYEELLRAACAILETWPSELQAAFVAAHPRIGETRGLSRLSAAEQGQRALRSSSENSPSPQAAPVPSADDPAVLASLAHLNACYEARFPGLRYITFVNGRPRAVIRDELEAFLRAQKPDASGSVASVRPVLVGGEAWSAELRRAVADVGKIADSRLRKMLAE